MNRIDRLSAILIQLQSKKIVKAAEIANRFDISIRTVYRDIRALEKAGIPIGAEAGVGYFLSSEYHLPPVMFTKEEACAFLLAEKLICKMSDSKVSHAFESALYKVKSVLKISEKEYLDNLNNKIIVLNYNTPTNKELDLYLFDIQTALANKKVLQIEYEANYNSQNSKRNIEPISLCNYGMRWHLIAYCRLRSDYRDFRLDRVKALTILDENYTDKSHITLNEYFHKISEENSLFSIDLKVHKSIFDSLASSKYWFGLVEEIHNGEYYNLKFANSNIQVFSKWVLSMEDKVEIISPQELKTITKNNVAELFKHYK